MQLITMFNVQLIENNDKALLYIFEALQHQFSLYCHAFYHTII